MLADSIAGTVIWAPPVLPRRFVVVCGSRKGSSECIHFRIFQTFVFPNGTPFDVGDQTDHIFADDCARFRRDCINLINHLYAVISDRRLKLCDVEGFPPINPLEAD